MISQEFIRKNLYQRSILSYLLLPFSLVFLIIVVIRRAIYETFPSLSYNCPVPVISIGNIVSGGSGKTPLTIFLAKYLTGKGKKIAVSHRGYRGEYEKANKLISNQDGVFSIAKFSGDEAYLLAEKLPGIPVIAGSNRKRSLQILCRNFPDLDYIILDDSLQHLKVKHDLDLITINSEGGIGNSFLLPAGILREPVSVLKKADVIIYNGSKEIPSYLKKLQDKVVLGEYVINGIFDLNNTELEKVSLNDKRIALLSGIGNPVSFEHTVKQAGLEFIEHFKFPDHHDYTVEDLNGIIEILDNGEMDLIITTEKDAVKLMKIELDKEKIAVLQVEFYSDDLNKIKTL